MGEWGRPGVYRKSPYLRLNFVVNLKTALTNKVYENNFIFIQQKVGQGFILIKDKLCNKNIVMNLNVSHNLTSKYITVTSDKEKLKRKNNNRLINSHYSLM